VRLTVRRESEICRRRLGAKSPRRAGPGPRLQVDELRGRDTTAGDIFGWSVALCGATIVVGADGHGRSGSGRAYVFAPRATGWRQVAELAGVDTTADDGFGAPVAISGTTIVAGAEHATRTGKAYIFTEKAARCRQAAELREPGASADDLFGDSVAVSGTTVVVGSPGHGPNDSGSAYVVQT
jgi:FG-GAP repeat